MDFLAIEQAAFNAWPAQHQSQRNGITLRISEGYTKRANSANVLNTQHKALQQLISEYETSFNQHQLNSIFRLPSFINQSELDKALQQQCYKIFDHTHVLTLDLSQHVNSKHEAIDNIKYETAETWLNNFCNINQIDTKQHQHHLAVLKRIQDKAIFATLYRNQQPLACGLGVINNHYFGLFDIATAASERRKGHATHLINTMINWAKSNHALYSYIQVVANNRTAVKLYEKLGYKKSYDYYYRIKLHNQ